MIALESQEIGQIDELAKRKAREFSSAPVEDGYQLTALYQYTDENGNAIYWRIRLDHPQGGKWIRPLSVDGSGQWHLSMPSVKRMPLYGLPWIIQSTGTVYVVEGEKCADALVNVGLAATTSGGATSAKRADWRPLTGRDVVVWPDNDSAGISYAHSVCRALEGIAATVRIVDVLQLGLEDKGDCVDWLERVSAGGSQRIDALATYDPPGALATAGNGEWPEPEPLRRLAPPADPYPMDALGGLLNGAADDMSRIVQAPGALIGQSLLAAAALAAQSYADVTVDGRRSPLSLFFLTVAETGERKSAVDKIALAPHSEREYELRMESEAEQGSYESDLASYKKARDVILKDKKKDRDATRLSLEELGAEPQAPINPVLTSGDPTLEGLVKALIHGWPSMGLFSSEGARFFGGYAMSKDHALKTAAGLSELWDGSPVERTRSIDGSSKHYGKRASLHLMAQPGVASLLLGDPMVRDQGLLSRMLVAWPEGTTGTRSYVAEAAKQAPGVQKYHARMKDWLSQNLPLTDGKQNELAPRELLLNHQAHEDFVAFYGYVEKLMREGCALESVRGLANKSPELASRIAGVLTLVADPGAERIQAEYMAAGIAIMRYYLAEALRLHEVAACDPDLELAERCLTWLRGNGPLISAPDLYQRGPNPVRDKTKAEQVLELLANHGLVRPIGAGRVNGVLRREVWEVRK